MVIKIEILNLYVAVPINIFDLMSFKKKQPSYSFDLFNERN